MENMRDANKNDREYKNHTDNDVWLDFATKCKNNVHIALAMSYIGDMFKTRLKKFPSLVNCCAIDWFLAWPEEALKSVAEHFLKEVEDLPEIEGIVSICVDMQLRTRALTIKYEQEQKRYYYVTPTSYLVLLQSFKELLDQKRLEIDSIIHKYGSGIDTLNFAKKVVGELEEDLKIKIPKVKKA